MSFTPGTTPFSFPMFRAHLERKAADPPETTGTAANHLGTVDKTASAASLVTDIFMKKGIPKLAAQLFMAKVGMFTNLYSGAQSYKKGDSLQAGISIFKAAAALGLGRFYNLADAVGNAEEAYRNYQSGDFESVAVSGAKLLFNVGATFSPPMAIASAVLQVGTELAKNGI
ncbi:hypothetical protein [Acidovorax sp. CCYZU-2555]|uniref:hypothetical protein n=1 Tax=Acidovorax sp. CCYZU-2555 TaxID=2835042 RepID=UPI001BCB42B3|nr:hypothetical protein [Acidovorax sp. CCYZU-2555]MBS7777954.1 hypothetical protein [Acidovorax sp. CCYZU-2555]